MAYSNIYECPKCGGVNVYIVNSRKSDGVVRRDRKCIDCEEKFQTIEMHVDDYLKMKSDKDLLDATRKAFWNLGIGENKNEIL